MTYFIINDSYYKHTWGLLEYNEKSKEFRLYIRKDKKFKNYPIMMYIIITKHKRYVFNPDESLMWVKERLVPPSRQNIDNILSDIGISEYDEFELLKAWNGRCPQDDNYLELVNNNTAYEYAKKHKIELQ